MTLPLAAAGIAVNALWGWLAARQCRRSGHRILRWAVLAFAAFQAVVWATIDPFAATAAIGAAARAPASASFELGAAIWTTVIAPGAVVAAVVAWGMRRALEWRVR